MNRFLKLLVFVIPFSFLIGAWWGLHNIEKRLPVRNKSGVGLKLLYRKGSLSPQIFSRFEEKTGLSVEGYPMKTDQALWEELSEHPDSYDLIQLFSYMAKAPVNSQVFAPLNPQWLPNWDKVSVDFSRLPFDPEGKYLLPLNWGLNGFLWNLKNGKPPSTLKALAANKKLEGKIFLLPRQVEIFSYLQKTEEAFAGWLDQKKWKQLSKATQKLLKQVQVEDTPPQEIWRAGRGEVVQIANGPAAEVIQQTKKSSPLFWLPEEKANLWVSLIGISKSTSQLKQAHRFISFLLEDSSIQLLVKFNHHATSLQPDKVTPIKPMQLPTYLRQIALDRIQLSTETASLTPLWFQTLSKTLPQLFSNPHQKSKKLLAPITSGKIPRTKKKWATDK